MRCCLVDYLQGVRAYQRRIKELKGAVQTLRAAYFKTLDDAAFERRAMKGAIDELKREIAAARARIAELEARDKEERDATSRRGDEATRMRAGSGAELTEPWERSGTCRARRRSRTQQPKDRSNEETDEERRDEENHGEEEA